MFTFEESFLSLVLALTVKAEYFIIKEESQFELFIDGLSTLLLEHFKEFLKSEFSYIFILFVQNASPLTSYIFSFIKDT